MVLLYGVLETSLYDVSIMIISNSTLLIIPLHLKRLNKKEKRKKEGRT